jgi:DNA-binding beta-propeller fold protein YncE
MLVFCSIGKGLRKVYLKDESIVEIVDFDANLCSRVTSFNDRLYYTDSNRGEVVCCDINGTIVWTFTNTSVSKDQHSIAVDNYGNVYVVGPRSANVIVISPDGKKHKQLLSKTDRLDNPWALHYDWKTRQLLVTNSTESQLTYTTNRQKNISTCPHRVVILNIAPKVFRTAKLSESKSSAPMNKLPKNGLGN